MTGKLSYISYALLGLSGVFNAFFAGGFIHARSSSAGLNEPERRVEVVSDRLGLAEPQRRCYAQLRQEFSSEARPLREAILLGEEERLAELSSESPDPVRLRQADDRLAGLHAEYRLLSGEYRRRFLVLLTPPQRREVLRRLRAHFGPQGPTGDLWRRIDTDGDGRISEQERAKAREAIETWRSRARNGG